MLDFRRLRAPLCIAACVLGLAATATAQPTISNISYSPNPLPVEGGQINVSAKVSDSVSISSVNLYVLAPNGSVDRSGGMSRTTGDGFTYGATVGIDLNSSNSANGETLQIVATDVNGGSTTATVATQGFSNKPPTISGITFAPKPLPIAGGNINVSTKVTDSALPITSVNLYVIAPSGSVARSTPMSPSTDGGDVYSTTIGIDLNSSNSSNGESLEIVATDVAGNQAVAPVATQGYSAQPPAIGSIAYTPKPLPVAGGDIDVSVKVTDPALPISTVNLYVYSPSNDLLRSTGMSPTSDGGDVYSATIGIDLNSSNSMVGESLYVTATDVAGNSKTVFVATQSYSNQPPRIAQVQYLPKPLPIDGGDIDVSAQVADLALPITTVNLNVLAPNGSTARSTPMSPTTDGGDVYWATIGIDLNNSNSANGESIVIVATDAAGNQTTTPVATQGFSKVAPTITGITYTPNPLPVEGGNIDLSATVKDAALPITTVNLYVLTSSGSVARSTPMSTGGDGGNVYSATIGIDLNSSNSAKGESLVIVATDAAGNSTTTAVATQGFSNTPPTITGIIYSPSPLPVAGGNIDVSATVRDSVLPITSVNLYVLTSSGSVARSTPMSTGGDGGNDYSATIGIDLNSSNSAKGESLVIVATDAAGNSTTTAVATQGFSNTPPTITGIIYSPSPLPVAGGNIDVSATVRDSVLPITSVNLYVLTSSGSVARSTPMSTGGDGGNDYSATIGIDLNSSNSAKGESLVVVAIDAAGNRTSTPVATQGFSNVAPKISNVVLKNVQGGVDVTATVTDQALPITSVTLNVIYKGQVVRSTAMSFVVDGIYTAGIALDAGDVESLQIVAVDAAGNTTSYATGA